MFLVRAPVRPGTSFALKSAKASCLIARLDYQRIRGKIQGTKLDAILQKMLEIAQELVVSQD